MARRSIRCGYLAGAALIALVVAGCPWPGKGASRTMPASTHTVAYWKFSAPPGPTLADQTGRYPGVVTGVTAARDGAWTFPGGHANVRVPNAEALHLEGSFTIEALVRPARLGSSTNDLGVQSIVEKHIAPGGYLLIIDKEGRLEYWLETAHGQTKDHSTLAVPIDGRFHHVAMTWDGATGPALGRQEARRGARVRRSARPVRAGRLPWQRRHARLVVRGRSQGDPSVERRAAARAVHRNAVIPCTREI